LSGKSTKNPGKAGRFHRILANSFFEAPGKTETFRSAAESLLLTNCNPCGKGDKKLILQFML
jgi:hypothetical protein